MRALLWNGAVAQLVDHPPPEPAAGMALVLVRAAGICKTDIEITKGYMNFRGVLGHEFVGTVEHGPAAWQGRRVVADINFACGTCAACLRGLQRHCPTRRVMGILDADGAVAEMVAVPVANLHLVPDAIGDDAAVFTEPLAAAYEILEQIHVQPGLECIVLGDGKLGLLVAQVLFHAGARVLAVGKHDSKLAMLRKRGIEAVAATAWHAAPADLVVEATGSPTGFAMAVAATKPRGTLVLKSTVAAALLLDMAPLVINEITVVGSRCGSFPPALQALETGAVDVQPMISARFALRDATRALEVAASPGVLKVLVQP